MFSWSFSLVGGGILLPSPAALLTLNHNDPVDLDHDDEDVLASEEDHELVEHVLPSHQVEPIEEKGAVLHPHGDQQTPDLAGAAGHTAAVHGTLRPWLFASLRGEADIQGRAVGFRLGQDQRELHESPGEEAQADQQDAAVGFHLRLFKGVEDIQDVGPQSHIDHKELGELVPGHVPLWHEPSAQN